MNRNLQSFFWFKTFAEELIKKFLHVYLGSSLAFYKVHTGCFANNLLFFCNNTHNVPLCFTVDNIQTELFYGDQGVFDLSPQVPSQIHNNIT